MAVIVVMVVTVRTVNVAMSQLFFGCFTDSDNFYVELKVLASPACGCHQPQRGRLQLQ